jgi:hypothetical protein
MEMLDPARDMLVRTVRQWAHAMSPAFNPAQVGLMVREWADAMGLRLTPAEVEEIVRRNSRKRPPGMASAMVEPPRGPKPLQGGAAAPLEFGD